MFAAHISAAKHPTNALIGVHQQLISAVAGPHPDAARTGRQPAYVCTARRPGRRICIALPLSMTGRCIKQLFDRRPRCPRSFARRWPGPLPIPRFATSGERAQQRGHDGRNARACPAARLTGTMGSSTRVPAASHSPLRRCRCRDCQRPPALVLSRSHRRCSGTVGAAIGGRARRTIPAPPVHAIVVPCIWRIPAAHWRGPWQRGPAKGLGSFPSRSRDGKRPGSHRQAGAAATGSP